MKQQANQQSQQKKPIPSIPPEDKSDREVNEPFEKDEPSEILTQAAGKESESEKRRRGIGQDYELDGQSAEPVIPSVGDKIQTGISGPNKTSNTKYPGDMPKEWQM